MLKRTLSLSMSMVMIQFASIACEYNVRDVGFVDLKTMPYTLYLYVNNETPAEVVSNLDDGLFMGLLDSNIDPVMVNVDTESTHHAVKLLDEHPAESYPSAILVSPKGFHQSIAIADASQSGIDAVEEALASLISSPFRSELLDQVTATYGVVLIVEGPDADENAEVRDAATRSVRQIHTRMKMLPKAIANPPVVLSLAQSDFAQESMLLWSLGLNPNAVTGAHAVVLYGRGRQMGPVLTGEALNEKRLTSYLSIIGADCECGLDRSWMQGTMIPLQWSDEIQSMVSSSLGFDPENPRTKMEISMTVAKGQQNRMNGGSDTKNPDSISKLSFAYNEDIVTFDDDGGTILNEDNDDLIALAPSLLDGDASRNTGSGDAIVIEPIGRETVTIGGMEVSRLAMFLGVVASLVIVVSSAGIVVRATRR